MSRAILPPRREQPGPHPSRPPSGRRRGAGSLPRARLPGDDHRRHQRPLRRPGGDRVPAVLLEARDPQGPARRVHRRRRPGAVGAGTAPGRRPLRRGRPREAPRRVRQRHAWRSTRGAARSTASSRAPRARILRPPRCSPTTSTRETTARAGSHARWLALARCGPGYDERDAADLIHALMSPELYRLLVIDRGWAPERYEQWLARTLTDQLTTHRRRSRAAPGSDPRAASATRLDPPVEIPERLHAAGVWPRTSVGLEPSASMTQTEPVPWRSGSPQSPTHCRNAIFEPSGENIGLDNAAPGTLISDRMTVPARLTRTISS